MLWPTQKSLKKERDSLFIYEVTHYPHFWYSVAASKGFVQWINYLQERNKIKLLAFLFDES